MKIDFIFSLDEDVVLLDGRKGVVKEARFSVFGNQYQVQFTTITSIYKSMSFQTFSEHELFRPNSENINGLAG